MKVFKNPPPSSWSQLLQRPVFDTASLEQKVQVILKEVKTEGDAAVKRYTQLFDKAVVNDLQVEAAAIAASAAHVSKELQQAIRQAKSNIETFHRAQVQPAVRIETMPGVQCWRKSVPIQKVGLYIPGGTAPLFSTILMLAIPAKIAGCSEIILCSPPDASGNLHPAILFTAGLVGISKIFKVGGVQAVAAMSYGTASIPKVDKIFGPGNQYVTCAKQLVQKEGVAIDLPAGPSEVAVYADESADPAFVAADLLSQAEHGADSQVLLVVNNELLIEQVQKQLDQQLNTLPRKQLALKALENSKLVLVKNEEEAMALLNEYAPEHLILSSAHAEALSEKVTNAGSVFLGHYSPESAGDYASGTNHTLPTNGYARAYSGVSVDSFVKKITFQKLDETGITAIGNTVIAMANAEGLQAHARAVSIRLEKGQA
jgi:histidinol dehydrogenase